MFLLDDALAHLDARQRIEARTELARLHRELGTTMVSVTHDQAEALAVGDRVAVMNAGVLEQIGPPRFVYTFPVNVFVAGFVGSPSMNLVPMTVEAGDDGPVMRAGSLDLPAPEWIRGPGAGPEGAGVTVGIRPEHIRVGASPADRDAGFRGRCDLVEFLGHQVLVHLRVGDVGLQAFDDPARHVRPGDIVDCCVPLDRIHLFDSQTGRALEPVS